MASQCMRFTRVSASGKRALAFSFVWRHNTRVSPTCLHLLRRLTRFPLYWVTMHAFHTRVCIDFYGFCVFLGMASQCMRFTRTSASIRWLPRFPWYGITMHAFHTGVRIGQDGFCVFFGMGSQFSASFKTTSMFSLVWLQSICVSHVSLYRLRRLLRFPWYGVRMNAFHTHVCIV